MPAHADDASDASLLVNSSEVIACPQYGADTMTPPASDNTAAGISLSQELSMYEEEKKDIQLPIPVYTPPVIQRTPSPDIPPQRSTIRSADHTLRRKTDLKPWEFSTRRMSTRCPSSLFQNGSKYSGTQQSDRQIYNVEVTILTVDMDQCTTSGYLEICGLTPDHPTLTTFFTGEIIGGPDQKYSFKTKDQAWGANDRTDVTHWARFPAWRSLSQYAKNDMDFEYPVDGSQWWQQENIFMRWKEHFLVPDHKLRSIAGASFEGFYYICLNQIEGRISGIYFHSKSEKYQQLELRHEGKTGIWNQGVRPSVEFR